MENTRLKKTPQICVVCQEEKTPNQFWIPQIVRTTRRVWVGKDRHNLWRSNQSEHITDKYYHYHNNPAPFCLDCWQALCADGWMLLSSSPVYYVPEDTRAVYCMFALGKPFYAGQSLDLLNRIASHNIKSAAMTRDPLAFIAWWDVPPIMPIVLETAEANLQRLRDAEQKLIHRFNPEMNKNYANHKN
jgi:predicted GIY-YIG superfamily endonuclease